MIYCEIYGVFGNLTKRFADRLDGFEVVLSQNSVIEENYLMKFFPLEALISMAEEPGFWANVEKYVWFAALLERLFMMSEGELYLLMDWEYREQLTERRVWCEEKFGTTLADNLILTADKNRPLLVRGRQDLLIDCDLYNIERWTAAGGSGFFWPEIHWNASHEEVARILARRLGMVEDVMRFLKKPVIKGGGEVM